MEQRGSTAPRPVALPRRVLAAAVARVLRMPPGRADCTVLRTSVRMRDGVELLTDVHAPTTTSLGTVLIRTPYGRTGLIAQLTAGWLATHGYHVVNQSCRGTSGSGGVFRPFAQEVADGADTVAWLRRQPWFSGRFALWGASYLGYSAWAVMAEPPPELAAAVVAISAHDNHEMTHGSGAVALQGVVDLLDALGHLSDGPVAGALHAATAGRRLAPAFEQLPLVRALDTVLAGSGMPYLDWLTGSAAEDAVWRAMRVEQALERVDVPVLLQAGWQDPFADQMLEQYRRLRDRGVEVGLTVGPWTHVEVGTRGAGTVMTESLDWLSEHLGRTAGRRRPSPVHLYVEGAREWRHLPAWPPATVERVLHLQPGGGLDDHLPAADSGPTTFTFDPAAPTPSVGGRVVNPRMSGHRDNRPLEERADVVTFTGPPLVEAVEVMGSPVVELVHRTDNPHADLFVRLCEAAADGRSVNVSDGFTRLGPGRADGTVRLRLEAVAHRFAPGTRIRLQVSGGAHPRYARNLGTAEDPVTSSTLAPSRRAIFHGDGGVSRVLLPCVPL
ncbi:CocE/NonD family hydrolase [Nocardioides sediminis]|uniref:CocE/NonD family hydrolase n=1 Tax=Nocardioides sediminis TaxID=433648 RepID=UPI000D3007A3|nr:CocE/NonD family hydrolase [Nocardioides sediminis]